MTISFVHTILTRALADWSSQSFADVELALYLLHAMVETKANLPGTDDLKWKQFTVHYGNGLANVDDIQKTLEMFFSQATSALAQSGQEYNFSRRRSFLFSSVNLLSSFTAVFKHSHKAVVIQTFENFASYAQYIPNDQALMTAILDAFVTLYELPG